MSALSTWLQRDDAPDWFTWLYEPREMFAYWLSDLGGRLARLGNRIHPDAVGDYSLGYANGEQMAQLVAAHRRQMKTTREDVVRLLDRLGLPSDDATLERMGWPEERVDNGGIEEDNESD